MSADETELTFIRCPGCRSLVPAVASRCRMCGEALQKSEARPNSGSGEFQRKSRVRQKTMSVDPERVQEAKDEAMAAFIPGKTELPSDGPEAFTAANPLLEEKPERKFVEPQVSAERTPFKLGGGRPVSEPKFSWQQEESAADDKGAALVDELLSAPDPVVNLKSELEQPVPERQRASIKEVDEDEAPAEMELSDEAGEEVGEEGGEEEMEHGQDNLQAPRKKRRRRRKRGGRQDSSSDLHGDFHQNGDEHEGSAREREQFPEEAPRQQHVRHEQTRQEFGRRDEMRQDSPKHESPKHEAPRQESPRHEAQRPEPVRQEQPRQAADRSESGWQTSARANTERPNAERQDFSRREEVKRPDFEPRRETGAPHVQQQSRPQQQQPQVRMQNPEAPQARQQQPQSPRQGYAKSSGSHERPQGVETSVGSGRLVGWLVNFKENPQGEAIEIRDGRFFVSGERLRDSDLVLPHQSVSTPHCLIKVSESGVIQLQDMMSEGGTFIRKGRGAEEPVDVATVQNGDILRFGSYEVLVCLVPKVD